MKEDCLICHAPLVYLQEDEEMTCAICHKTERSKTKCVSGHYVCNACHTQGLDRLFGLCLSATSTDPAAILNQMMALPSCHMHGPEHHTMVGMALLTAYHNAGGKLDLPRALREMKNRSSAVPGGACGFWGACGAGLSTGMFVSLVTAATPLAEEPFALAHRMTSRALGAIAAVGGPRCCKRDAYLSLLAAVDFSRQELGVTMTRPTIRCAFSDRNAQCLRDRCPFYPAKPNVVFLCVHNACRSQMAEALGRKLAGDVFHSFSAGSTPKAQIDRDAVRLMRQQYGIDLDAQQRPKTLEDLPPADLYVTMGCGAVCPVTNAATLAWELPDPTGQDDEAFLAVMAEIEAKILALRETMASAPPPERP